MTGPATTKTKIAFVSGGSKGIGLAVVRALVAADYFVVSCGRNQSTWKQVIAGRYM